MTAPLRQTAAPAAKAEATPARPGPEPAATVALGVALLPAPEALRQAGFDDLAQALGLPRDRTLVRFERAGFGLSATTGRVEGGRIILHPDRFRPRLPQGRGVLAHELAHLAQARLGGAAALLPAEYEAVEIGHLAAEGRVLPPARQPLSPATVLRDDSLEDLIAQRYANELIRIRDLLRGWLGFLWVTDGAIREALTMVEGLPFEVVRAIFGHLTPDQRETFLDNVSPGHFPRFRREILAAFSMTEAGVIAEQDEDLFRGMDFHGLEPAEVVALGDIFDRGFPAAALARLRADPAQRPHLGRLLDTDLRDRAAADYNRAGAVEQARSDLEASRDNRAAAATAARADDTGAAAIARITALMADPDDAARIAALDTLSGFLGRPQIFEGIVEALQAPTVAGGVIDTLLDGFPGEALIAQAAETPADGAPTHSRIETLLRLAALRPPWKNVALAEDLLSSAWIFNVVTSAEALLAFQLVKALPDPVRAGLMEENGGRFGTRLYASLSQSMRESAGLNFYRGGEGRLDLAGIQAQLLDDLLWSRAEIGRLQGLIRMAGAAGEQEWVFNRSRQISEAAPQAYDDEVFRAQIVEPFMLYDSRIRDGGRRAAWEPAYGDWAVENAWDMIGQTFATIGHGFALLGDSREPGAMIGNALFGRSLGGEGISAVALQNLMGGSFMGIRFVSPEDRFADPELAAEVAAADEADRGVNYIDSAFWDTDRGVIEMRANALAIAAIRYPIGDMLVSTGAGRIEGMEMTLGYPTRETGPRPTTMDLRMGTLELHDLLIVLRGSMLGVNTVTLTGLEVDLGRDAIANRLPEAGRGVEPWAINPITPILRMIGLTLGSEITDRAGEIVTALTAPNHATPLMVTVENLTLSGVLTSGGQYIESVAVGQARIGIAGSLDDYFEILWQSVRANIQRKVRLMMLIRALPEGAARDALQQRIDRIASRVSALQAFRREILAAQEVVARLGPARSTLSDADRAELETAEAFLAPFANGGITVDVGRLHVAGMRGRITTGALELTDVHGRGHGSAGLLAFLTDSEALGRIIDGPAHVPATVPELGRETAEFTLELNDITLEEFSLGAGIPTVAEAAEGLAEAETALAERSWDPGLIALADETRTRHTATVRYHALAAAGVSYLSPADAAELARLRDTLLAAEALYVHHLEARQATLGFSAGRGAITFGADWFEATGQDDVEGAAGAAIRAGDRSIRRAEGRGVSLSVGVTGGLSSFADFTRRLDSIGISGTSLRLEGIADPAAALGIDVAEAQGFDLDLSVRAGVLDATADRLSAEGIRGRLTRPWLTSQIVLLENKPPTRRTPADDTALAELREQRDILDEFEAGLAENAAALAAASTQAERERLQGERDLSISLFLHWEQRLGARSAVVEGLDARISGLGNLAESDFSLDHALATGITVQGRGQSTDRPDRIFSRAEITDARFGEASASRIELGETAGRMVYSTSEIFLDNIGIESLTLDGLLITSRSAVPTDDGGGTMVSQIYSDGVTTAQGVRVTARLAFVPTEQDEDQYRLDRVTLETFRIARLEAGSLGYGSTHQPPTFGMPDPQGIYTAQDYTIDGGALLGVRADGLTITMPATAADDMVISGTVGLESVSGTRASAFLQDALTGAATLNGESLSIRFLEEGGQIIDIGERAEGDDGSVSYSGGLRLSQGEVALPQGTAAFSTGTIQGRIRNQNGVTRFEGIAVPSVTLQRLNFAAAGKSLRAASPVSLTGIHVDASYDRTDRANPRLTLDRLRIASITGDDLTVIWPPYTVQIRQDPAVVRAAESRGEVAPPPLQVVGLEVDDLAWSGAGGVVPARGDRAHLGIESLHGAFDLLAANMDLDAVVDAQDLRFDFLRDGSQQLEIEEVNASFRGQAATGVTVDVTIDDLSTGQITIADGTVTVPHLTVPTITLDALDVVSPDLRLLMPGTGGRITLTGTEASAIIDLAEPPSTAPFERLTILGLVVPTITMRGVRLVLPDALIDEDGTSHDITVTVPDSETATITNLSLTPMPGDPGFVIEPDPTGAARPKIDGRLHVDRAQGAALGFAIENRLRGRTDFDAANLDLDFISAAGIALSLEEVRLSQTTVDLGPDGVAAEHRLSITSAPGGSQRSMAPEAVIRGIRRGTDGAVSVDAASLSGLVYERPGWGVRVDVGTALLPAQADGSPRLEYGADGSLVIPELSISDAAFRVNDILNVGGTGGAGASSRPLLADLDFLDALHGTVGFTIGHPNLPNFVSERLDLRLENGVFNLDQIENQISVDHLIDFDLEGNRLVLNFDYGNALGPIPAIIPYLNKELAAFDLKEPNEITDAETREIRLSTMVQRFEPGAPGGGEVPISVRDIEAVLELRETRMALTDHGTILLGGNGELGALGITATGGLHPSTAGVASQISLAVDQINASVDPDDPLTFGGATVEEGALTITDIHDTTLHFRGVTEPNLLEGVIGGAVIRNLRVTGL